MRLLAIDGNSVLNRGFFGISRLTAPDGTPTNALVGFINILLRLNSIYKPDATAIAFDVSRKTFRNELYDQYKANRKGMPDELRVQLPIIQEMLGYMGYNLATAEGFEGDDVLGTLAKSCDEKGIKCVIATGDRDCLQLVSDKVSVALLKMKEDILYTPQSFAEEYGFPAINIIDLKAIMGDSSDNIPGVKGIGEKGAMALIAEYNTIERIYDEIDSLNAKPRTIELLRNDKEAAFMSKQLATISTDAPIDTSIESYIKGEGDRTALATLLKRLNMDSLIKKFKLDDVAIESVVIDESEKSKITATEFDGEQQFNRVSVIVDNEKLICGTDSGFFTVEKDNKAFLAKAAKKEIVCCGAKKLYKLFAENEIEIEKDIFDNELAAYLLNPDRKSYSFELMAQEYIAGVEIVGAEGLGADTMKLLALSDVLKEKLAEAEMEKLLYEIELPLCRVLSDMESEGFEIDSQGLNRFGEMIESDIKRTESEIIRIAGEEFNINSTKELGRILFEKLELPTGKKTKTGYSTNVDVLEKLSDKHEIVPLVLEYRRLTKLLSTYVVGLSKAISDDGRVHSTFNQTETRTGRISSLEPNVQNIPVRTRLGSEMRRFFVARQGYTLIDADYSQIELRLLAHIADDKAMKQAFLDGVDIHSVTASQVFNVPLESLPSELRSRAKAINFGIVYGIGAFSLSKDINSTVGEAKEYIEAYLNTYHGVADYMTKVVEKATEDGFVTTIYGRKRYLPELQATNKLIKAFGERVALNTPIQGTAADIIKLAMVRVYERLKKEAPDARLILQVHDELIVEAPVMQAEQVKRIVVDEMEHAASLSVPLRVDAHIGRDWYMAKG